MFLSHKIIALTCVIGLFCLPISEPPQQALRSVGGHLHGQPHRQLCSVGIRERPSNTFASAFKTVRGGEKRPWKEFLGCLMLQGASRRPTEVRTVIILCQNWKEFHQSSLFSYNEGTEVQKRWSELPSNIVLWMWTPSVPSALMWIHVDDRGGGGGGGRHVGVPLIRSLCWSVWLSSGTPLASRKPSWIPQAVSPLCFQN